MKKLACVVALVLALAGVTPATAAEERGLGPTGLLEAKKDGFDGTGFEFAVISPHGFNFASPAVKRAIKSEACFAGSEDWEEKCKNGDIEHLGKGSSQDPQNTYSNADSLIYSLAGSAKMIAPKSKAHAIWASDIEETFPAAVLHAAAQNVSVIFFTNIFGKAKRGMEINCDAAFPEATKIANQAKDLGIALISEPGSSGDAFGFAFPACLSAVTPVGHLGFFGEIAESTNVGPGLVLSHTVYETIAESLDGNGQVWLADYDSAVKSLAVAGGIFGALVHLGFSTDISLQALGHSAKMLDDVVVKDLPVINYLDAKAWATANANASTDLVISAITQVSSKEVAAVLRGDPSALTNVELIGYEIYNATSLKWERTAVSERGARAMRIAPNKSSGWLRLVLKSQSRTHLTAPKSFKLESVFVPNFAITDSLMSHSGEEEEVLPSPPSVERSVVDWPTIIDPALEQLELNYARDMQVTGKGVTVAIIDDGYQFDHPYLSGSRVVEGLCLETDYSCPNGTNKQFGITAAEPKINPDTDARESHGTMVAGTIGGFPTSSATGGIAPEVTFIVARIDLNGSDENGDYIAQALNWIGDLADEYNIASVNMSFGYQRPERDQILNGSACNSDLAFEEAAQRLKRKGIAAVVAAGNDGLVQGIGGPACEGSAIAVGATDNDGTIINYSNISEEVRIVAPARKNTSLGDKEYGEGSGTSNATPVVAGAFALAKQLRPDLTVDEVLFAMQQSADRVNDLYVKEIPRLNIRKFLDYLALGSEFDSLRPAFQLNPIGLSCVVDFDARDSLRADLRYKAADSNVWTKLEDVSSPLVVGGLLPHTDYLFELGGIRDAVTLWSERKTCVVAEGQAPKAVSDAQVEAFGAGWIIAYLPSEGIGYSGATHLNYLDKNGNIAKAIPLGSSRYYFSELGNRGTLSLAFGNEWGVGSFAEIEVPVSSKKPFRSASLLRGGFRGSNLVATHKVQLARDLGALTGVNSITCTGYFLSSTALSARRTIEIRARKACDEAKKLHPTALVTVATKSTKVASFYGAVGVVAEGEN